MVFLLGKKILLELLLGESDLDRGRRRAGVVFALGVQAPGILDGVFTQLTSHRGSYFSHQVSCVLTLHSRQPENNHIIGYPSSCEAVHLELKLVHFCAHSVMFTVQITYGICQLLVVLAQSDQVLPELFEFG
uniref:(northern house mosquito) hypothetical protein n=1 Tax=Culex pipiens TaxID=7175 RepID=A0A8D8GES6_CULPI